MKPYLIAQLICLIAGLLVIDNSRPAYIKVLIGLVSLTVLNEFLFVPLVKIHAPYYRNVLYSGFSLVDMFTWFYVFNHILAADPWRRIARLMMAACIVWTSIDLLDESQWQLLHPNSFRAYEVCLILLGFRYLFTTLKKDYLPLRHDVNTWLCFACISFHSIFFINLTTFSYFGYWKSPDSPHIFRILTNIANLLYYSLLGTAFIFSIDSWKTRKS